jgi:chromosome segregation ATPase
MEDIQDRQEEINLKEQEKEVLKVRVKEFEALLNVATAGVNELEKEIYKLQTEASSIEDRTGSVETKKNELSVVSDLQP